MSDILSAVLPKSPEIRKELLSALERRFGTRLVVLRGIAFAIPAASPDLAPADASVRKIWEYSGFYPGLIRNFAGTDAEKRLARAIVENPTSLTHGKNGVFIFVRKLSTGELRVAVSPSGNAHLL